MSDLPTLGLFIAVGVGFWWMLRPRYAFVVQIKDGSAVCRKGRVNSSFLKHVAEICQWSDVRRGKIYGTLQRTHGRSATVMGRRSRIRLAFSPSIPAGCQQQIRNLSLVEQ